MVTHLRDLALVRECLAGDLPARDALGARLACIPRIVAARNRRLAKPLADALLHDVASDVTLQAWRRLSDYNGYAALESWLYRFCELTLLNAVRRERRERRAVNEVPEASAPCETRPDADLDAERLQLLLARLPVEEQAVVRSKHFDEATFEEIAATMGTPLTTAKGRYYRAMSRLRFWLAANEAEVKP